MLHTHFPFVLTHRAFNYFRLYHCPAFFFVSSLSPMPSVFPEVPPTLCIARIGGKGRDGCVCQQTMLPGSEDHVHWCSEENKSATTVHGCSSSSITEVGLKGKRCILCYSSSLHRLQDLWLKSDLKQIPLIPLHADFKTHSWNGTASFAQSLQIITTL